MHFWNKLSTAALMRLTILASPNLWLSRLVERLDLLLHPWLFLPIITLNLGLSTVMVYSGTLNKTLIGMMLGGLTTTLATLVFAGMGPSAFMYGSPFRELGQFVAESAINPALEALPAPIHASGPLRLPYSWLPLLGHVLIMGSAWSRSSPAAAWHESGRRNPDAGRPGRLPLLLTAAPQVRCNHPRLMGQDW